MEKHVSVDQKTAAIRQRVLDLIAAEAQLFAVHGTVVESWRRYHGRRHGPYFRLAFRLEGRQRAVYLGANCELAEEVRRVLGQLQAPHRRLAALHRQRKFVKRSLTVQKASLREELARGNLQLQGMEVRGWRALPKAR